MEDTPWEDTATEGQTIGGHSNCRIHHGRLQDTAWQDTGITGHIMGRQSKLYPSGIAWEDMP